MPVRDGLPASERRRHVPPRDTTTGPPEHPVEHRAVIGPPPTPTRDLVGQQRFQTSPFRIGQIVSMQHPPGLQHPALKIRGTRSSRHPGPTDPNESENTIRGVAAYSRANSASTSPPSARSGAVQNSSMSSYRRRPNRNAAVSRVCWLAKRCTSSSGSEKPKPPVGSSM